MQRYIEALIDADSGAALTGYYAQLTDATTLEVVPIYADLNGTPIEQMSGVENMARSGEAGMIAFVFPDGFYTLNIYAPDATTLVRRYRFIGSEIRNTGGAFAPVLSGGGSAGVMTGSISGWAGLNGSVASVFINATWTAHTGNGIATLSLPTSIGGVGITSDPSAPSVIPCQVAGEGMAMGLGKVLIADVRPLFNRIRLWEQPVGDGVSVATRSPFLLQGSGSLYLSASYPVLRT
jgi:hypothetical protein